MVSWENFGENYVDYNPLFETSLYFATRDEAFVWASRIAHDHGFALVKANNGAKNRKKDGLLASYFRCSRYGLPPPTDDPEKPRRSTKCSCPFRIRAVQNHLGSDESSVVWNIVTTEGSGTHNHDEVNYKDGDRHFAGLDASEKEYVRQQVQAGSLPRDIKSGLHQKTPDKPQPSSTQIYNETKKIRRELRGDRNTAQQMLALANSSGYLQWHETNPETREITHVFMSHPVAVKLFRVYHYVVLMDSTYKTNTYKNPLVEVLGITPTGASFLIACVLLPTESEASYIWLLRRLGDMLECVSVSPSVFVTDRELGLIGARVAVYPDVPHILCRWHVNRAVIARILNIYKSDWFKKQIFNNEEMGWMKVIDAPTEKDFTYYWRKFCIKWPALATYIGGTWGEHASKFVRCYTNDYLHFGNTATSRAESSHSLLKAWLKSANLTLDTMWSRIHSMLEGQHSKIRKELEDSRSRPRITTCTFSLLQGFVATKAIEIMNEELDRGLGLGIGLEARCGCVLPKTHGLPCACRLVAMKMRGRRVHLDDIHVFWRTLVYDGDDRSVRTDDDVLEALVEKARKSDPAYRRAFIEKLRDFYNPEDENVLPPPINENPKGRPRGSTTRSKSGFEHAQRKHGTPSTEGSTTAQVVTRGDFPPGGPERPWRGITR